MVSFEPFNSSFVHPQAADIYLMEANSCSKTSNNSLPSLQSMFGCVNLPSPSTSSNRGHHGVANFYQPLAQPLQHCSLLSPYTYEAMQRHYHHVQPTGNPFHRLAEAIVASKPVSPATALVRQSVIQKQSHGPTSKSYKGPSSLRGQRLVAATGSSNSSFAYRQHTAIFDRRSKRPLTKYEIERKRDLANKQERRRMHRLNDALNRLREIIPFEDSNTKNRRLSKIKTLQSAIAYIRSLEELLEEEPVCKEREEENILS